MSTLDKHMLKELLLVCSAIGSVESLEPEDSPGESPVQRFVRGENCLEWLQDLQRALRRDDDTMREICITISSWRVVQQKLVPLILECRDDSILVKTLIKIYVMLTMPLSKPAEEALMKPVNPKAQGDVRDQQARKRENALAQQGALHAFKRAFISKDVLSVIVGMLEEPLGHTGVARTEEDNFSVELCLTLLRNVLNIKDPTPGMVTSLGDHYVQMHDQLVTLFQDALLLDILLLLAQDVHARENAKLNLLLVEIFHCVIRDQDPGAIIAAHRAKVQREAFKSPKGGPSPARHTGDSLTSFLAKEKSNRAIAAGHMHSRHTRFGGTLQVGGEDGTVARIVANPFKDRVDCVPQATRKKTKRGRIFTAAASENSTGLSESHKATVAREALHDFCCSFLKTAYDPFMRSIKNEFRIDSSRLQPEDKGMMFRLMYFFMSFHHQKHQASVREAAEGGQKGAGSPKFELGYVLETMDLMSFNLVLREAETAIAEKNTKRLEECVAVLKEMMHIVNMLNESSEKAHQLVALGLLARIFYASEPLDKLHDIVRNWQPGKYTKRFLCHLVELVHNTLKALEWHTSGKAKYIGGVDVSMANKEDKKGSVDKAVLDRVAAAKKFDFHRYFRRLATNNTLRMYMNLLEHYAINSVRINHYILSFMMRLSKFTGRDSSKKRRAGPSEHDFERAADTVSFEPMLYNVYTLGVFQKILDDPMTRKSSFKHLVHYIKSVVRHLGALSQRNQLIFVEALFQHPNPQPFCETLHNVYHDAGTGDNEDYEPRKKRTSAKAETGEDDDSDDEDSDTPVGPIVAGEKGSIDDGGADNDQVHEEEWEESKGEPQASAEDVEKVGDGNEASGLGAEKRQRKHKLKQGQRAESSKKRSPRWTQKEDSFLRREYPLYADTGSAFAVLSLSDEMEVKSRTEEQIRARVEKLGLTSAGSVSSDEEMSDTAGKDDRGAGDDGAGNDKPLSSDDDEEQGVTNSVGSGSPPSPAPARRIKRISQPQSDDDSEGLFSSTEDNDRPALDSEALHRPTKRAILEDSSDEED